MRLDQDQLLERLDELEFFPEFVSELDWYLEHYINCKNFEVVSRLLESGASPNSKNDLDDYLFHLLDRYQSEKSTAGELILSLLTLLLEKGANPNRVVMNNQRAYDYSVHRKLPELTELLLKYGANKELREFI